MNINLTEAVREFIKPLQGRVISLELLRRELKIHPDSSAWDGLRVICKRLCEDKLLKPYGKMEGQYKVVVQYSQVRVFTNERQKRPIFDLAFPRNYDTGMQLDFADNVVIREGDLITIGGVKSAGKTTLAMNFLAENINLRPVIMGNEYTKLIDEVYDIAPRFYNRLLYMSDWVEWTDEDGDKFKLLPVREDYPENIVAHKLNIIDWINMEGDRNYDIGKVLEGVKAESGRGVVIIVLQKGEGKENPRGGQYVRDFSDLEILLDPFGSRQEDILMTIKGVKEAPEGKYSVAGKTYAYTIGGQGTKILEFREVKKCSYCRFTGYVKGEPCEYCMGKKYVDV